MKLKKKNKREQRGVKSKWKIKKDLQFIQIMLVEESIKLMKFMSQIRLKTHNFVINKKERNMSKF